MGHERQPFHSHVKLLDLLPSASVCELANSNGSHNRESLKSGGKPSAELVGDSHWIHPVDLTQRFSTS
jgi:hypothetical protein